MHLAFMMLWELATTMLKTTNLYIQLSAALVKKKYLPQNKTFTQH